MTAMSFSIDQRIYVDDKEDGKRYPCKIVEVSEEDKKVKIHFINWNKKYEETLLMDSARIHLDEFDSDPDDSFASVDEGPIGLAIGKLLWNVNQESQKVLSTFDIRLSVNGNFQKFKVLSLDNCANELYIT